MQNIAAIYQKLLSQYFHTLRYLSKVVFHTCDLSQNNQKQEYEFEYE